MTLLWIAIAALTLIALGFIAVPLWRFKPVDRTDDLELRRLKNVEVFQQRQEELDQELAEGLIFPEQHSRLKTELERSFLRDMEQLESERRKVSGQRHGRLLPAALALALPVVAVSLYLARGSSYDLQLPGLLEALRGAENAEQQEEALVELAGFLQKRFDASPDDLQNGYMLGTLYLELQDFDKAVETLERVAEAAERPQDRAAVLGQLAQARYLDAERVLTPEVRETMDQALALNPNEYAVMSILAIDAFLREDVVGALGYWRRQLSQVNPGSQDAQRLRERIAQVQALVPAGELPLDNQAAAGEGVRLEVHVTLAADLQNLVSDDMRVFVFARNSAGGPPLAAVDARVGDLPLTFTLDDSSPMAPGMPTLSSAETVVVGARISKSGTANVQSGDLQTLSAPLELASQSGPVQLSIDEVVP